MARTFLRFPEVGKPGGEASRFLRVDMVPDDFASLIETKGPRLGWARAAPCPCIGFNSQTDQFDPNCTICNGIGIRFFRDAAYTPDTAVLGKLTAEQKAILDKANGVLIRAWMESLSSDPDMFRVLGPWCFGSANCTMRPENRMGYLDRIISIDEVMAYSQLVDADGTSTLKTQYPVVSINDLSSLTRKYSDDDLTVVAGKITWNDDVIPSKGERLSISYQCHPVWVAWNPRHIYRSTLVKKRKLPETLQTPSGDLVSLPAQWIMRLEHLPLDPG